MCIAVIKPKGIGMPDRETLFNCFESNPHGAGFAYNRNGITHIIKGLMTFEDFYSELDKHQLDINENVFLHFRIATHGLRDGGNTHPFPITKSFTEMRKTRQEYRGFCLIHNGVFHYSNQIMKSYDENDIISDTMLFAKMVADELETIPNNYNTEVSNIHEIVKDLEKERALAFELKNIDNRNPVLDKVIENGISYSKIAIMDEDGNFIKFGNWIENKGVFYSNQGFSGYGRYGNSYTSNTMSTRGNSALTIYNRSSWYGYDRYDDGLLPSERFQSHNLYFKKKKRKRKEFCEYCQKYKRHYSIFDNGEVICSDCEAIYMRSTCKGCGKSFDDDDMATKDYCYDCFYEKEQEDPDENCICIACGQNYLKKDESKEKEVCQKCYEQFSCSTRV